MKENILAKRYARALFELAVERGIVEKIRQEIDLFNRSLETNTDFRHFLNSQEVSKSDKKKTIERLFQDRVSNVFFNFILVLLRKNRQSIFTAIVRQFEILFDKYKKKVRASTITAIPMDEATLFDLKTRLSETYKADVEIENKIDPDILGGIIIKVDGQVFDGSVQGQLKRIRFYLTENSKS